MFSKKLKRFSKKKGRKKKRKYLGKRQIVQMISFGEQIENWNELRKLNGCY